MSLPLNSSKEVFYVVWTLFDVDTKCLDTVLRVVIDIFLANSSCSMTRRRVWKKKWNKIMHATNGNISKAMRIDYWNPGYAKLENKLNQIKNIIQSRKPHVLFIGEANLWEADDKKTVKIDGYTLVTSCMMRNQERKYSRIVARLYQE